MDQRTGMPDGALEAAPERKIYHASRGRRLVFSFVFLLLLPFFLSLPGMLYLRVHHGQWADAAGLGVFGAAFAILMLLLLVELMFAVRTRIDVGETSVRMTLPKGRAVPLLGYQRYEVPYEDIKTVETRREVYGGPLMPVLLRGARLTLKDGSHIRLGYVSDVNVDPTFPFPEIAGRIAERARLPLIDRGSVRRSFPSKMLRRRGSITASTGTIEETDIANLNRRHSNLMLVLIGGLVLLMVIGLLEDFSRPVPEKHPGAVPAKATAPAKPSPGATPGPEKRAATSAGR